MLLIIGNEYFRLMATHIQTGRSGEDLAADFFHSKGYQLICRNWRHRHWEVDLIALRNDILHFIEVKTKTTDHFGYPEDEVDDKKMIHLQQAAEAYLERFPEWERIQFDILAITLKPELKFFLLEDVYV